MPLHHAVSAESEEVIQLLLDSGANINALGHIDSTPLHQAIARKSVKIVEFLLNNGAEINITDKHLHRIIYLLVFAVTHSHSAFWDLKMGN